MPTILYILYHKDYDAIKIGIGDIAGRRFKAHRTKGWVLVSYWYFKNRGDARRVESIVVNTLRDKYGHYLDKEDMPYGGYTETFNARKIKKKALIRMVNKAIEKVLIP
jgi:hypothetical protein